MIPRFAIVAVLVALALVVARRMGGGDEVTLAPPGPAPPARGAVVDAVADGETWTAALRLVDVASNATFAMPAFDTARPVLKAHWRQLRPPFVALRGDAARFVTSIALRTSGASETARAMAVGEPGTEAMDEGSFDQREAIVAPAPGSATFRVTLPAKARLSFAEGTVDATPGATRFVVEVVDEAGATHPVFEDILPSVAVRRWTEQTADLAAWAGHTVDLRLRTEPADSTPGSPVALWGNPTVLARTRPDVPYNVLWIVVGALRPDAITSFHDDADDAAKLHAPWPPLEALLPKIDGLTPAFDDIARRGARFTSAYSAGSWTRPGTLAMLAGARSSELGVDAKDVLLEPAALRRFYAGEPPLLSTMLRRHGFATRAFVNNAFMAGYTPVGLDMGFERVVDHRHRTRDTAAIVLDTTRWLTANRDTRFFAFVSFESPHEAYEPPARFAARVPQAAVPDPTARRYLGEVAEDDEAIGVVMKALDDAHLRERTIVVVTADHGETMSSAHTGTSGLERLPIRYHHEVSNFEETIRVPILVVGPKFAPGSVSSARCRTTDLAPTVLDVLGLEPAPGMSGRSLLRLPLESEPRVVVSEGRGSRAILFGHWRLILREGAARTITVDGVTRDAGVELFDLGTDPGERNDVARGHPDVVAEMRARLDAALVNAPTADARPGAPAALPMIRLRFAGGGVPHRITGTIRAKDAAITPVDLGRDAFRQDGERIDVAFHTDPAVAVGFDLVAGAASWDFWLDDEPLRDVFGGPYGLHAPALEHGVTTDAARILAAASAPPGVDPRRDRGLFVVRTAAVLDREPARAPAPTNEEGAEEMGRLLRAWGDARGPK